jgi:type I restriction enzyme S subunit
LNTIDFSSYVKGAGIPHIYYSDYKHHTIGVAKPVEQQKIASCLSSLDEVITGEQQKLELLKQHKKGLLQNLFPQEGETVPKLRFPEFKNAGEWEVKKLGEICENLDSKRVPITSTQRDKGNIPYYGASGIVDYVKDYLFDETLLCISEDGANLIDRNYPIAFTISGKTWVNNHAHVLRFDNFNIHVLIEKYINLINIQDFLTGMAQPKLSRGNLDIIPIPLPKNPKEQQKIASCLSSLDEFITAQTQKIEQLQRHKKGLLQGLFPNMNEHHG